jgi:hypothetical protein
VEIQVHGQECDLAGNIDISEPIIEFDTVKDTQPIYEADMRCVQVSMAVPYSALFNPFGE